MRSVLCGNFRVELTDVGGRVERLTLRAPTDRLLRSRPQPVRAEAVPVGRDREVAVAVGALETGVPVEFHGGCGIGKTTLLRHLATIAAANLGVPGVYLRVAPGESVDDLLHRVVFSLYAADRPVKLSREECCAVLSGTRCVVVLDDFAGPAGDAVELVRALAGGGLVVGCTSPVLGRHGTSFTLSGLADEAASRVLEHYLGRPVTGDEQPAVARFLAAIDGQPLRLRQAAALVGAGEHTFADLADRAERDPTDIDRLSVSALADHERRALAALTFTDGLLLPAELLGAIADVGEVADVLGTLHRRGLAEHRDDRFGLPVCQVESYRAQLFRYFDLARAARGIIDFLSTANPGVDGYLSAAHATLPLARYAAEKGDWTVASRLTRIAEPILVLAGRWETCSQLLHLGAQAAHAVGDRVSEALFAHEKGSLALCRDDLPTARTELGHALAVRQQVGEDRAAALTRDNLALLTTASVPDQTAAPAAPPPPRPRIRPVLWRAATVAVLVLPLLVAGVQLANRATPKRSVDAGQPTTPSPVAVPAQAPTASPAPVPSSAAPAAVTPTAPPSPPTAQAAPRPVVLRASADVDSSATWTDTGLVVRAGQPLTITAAGSWQDGDSVSGPDGPGKAWPDNFLNLTDLGVCNYCARTLTPHWDALVGYVGDTPPPPGSYTDRRILPEAQKVFLVGSAYRGRAPASGRLWLNMNADAYSDYTVDNAGGVHADIAATVTP